MVAPGSCLVPREASPPPRDLREQSRPKPVPCHHCTWKSSSERALSEGRAEGHCHGAGHHRASGLTYAWPSRCGHALHQSARRQWGANVRQGGLAGPRRAPASASCPPPALLHAHHDWGGGGAARRNGREAPSLPFGSLSYSGRAKHKAGRILQIVPCFSTRTRLWGQPYVVKSYHERGGFRTKESRQAQNGLRPFNGTETRRWGTWDWGLPVQGGLGALGRQMNLPV